MGLQGGNSNVEVVDDLPGSEGWGFSADQPSLAPTRQPCQDCGRQRR